MVIDKKGVVVVLVLVMLMLMDFMGGGTYARYALSATGTGNASVAKWAVKVNGSENTNFNLAFNTENGGADILPGKIAPGVTATAYVDVDLTGTEVSVEFDCALADNMSGFTAGTVSVGTPALSQGASGMALDAANKLVTISGNSAMNGTVRVPITLTWTESGNDEADTAVGKSGGGAMTIPVILTVRQHIAG